MKGEIGPAALGTRPGCFVSCSARDGGGIPFALAGEDLRVSARNADGFSGGAV